MNTLVQPLSQAPIAAYDPLRTKVCAEFLQMPGLALTVRQAARLFDIEVTRCADVLTRLVESGFLTVDDGCFRRIG